MSEKQYAYSEIFHSIQGEGTYTGVPTAWLRFFLCNLQCDGFGQKNPMDPSTYVLPYKEFPVDSIKRIEDLPVWKHGCDSSYSWSAKYKHLQYKDTARGIVNKIRQSMYHPHNPEGKFNFNGNHQHMCFTGGEPLMKHAQKAVIDIMEEMYRDGDYPRSITWETNGTQELTDDFRNFFEEYQFVYGNEVFWSVSPKLFSVSGEKAEDAIKPEIVEKYMLLSNHGQLKFVINGSDESWEEMESVIKQFREHGIDWPVWVMPLGATLEGQEGHLPGHDVSAAKIAQEAFKRGYSVSARVHVYLWGNTIGV